MRKTTWEVRHSSPCETGGAHGYSRFFRGKKAALVYWAQEKKARRLGMDSAVYVHHGGTRTQLYERLCPQVASGWGQKEGFDSVHPALLSVAMCSQEVSL